jgi:hypothetical protein
MTAPAQSAYPGSPVGGYPVPSTGAMSGQPASAATTQGMASGGSDTAPTVSWLAVLGVLILIRIAYERDIRGGQL